MAAIEGRVRELIEAPNFAAITTLRKDGSPHATVVWVDTDGEHVLLNSAEGRLWPRHLARDPRIAMTVMNLEDPYEFVEVSGRVAERTHDGAAEHIDSMERKYRGNDRYPHKPGEQRVLFRVAPERVRHRRSG